MVSATTMTPRAAPSQATQTGVWPSASAASAEANRSAGAWMDHSCPSQLRRPTSTA